MSSEFLTTDPFDCAQDRFHGFSQIYTDCFATEGHRELGKKNKIGIPMAQLHTNWQEKLLDTD